jgi:hypothetical protein
LDAGTLGAIIGGSAAGLLIIIGVVVFVVLRKRKTGNNQVAAAAPAASSNSAYGSVTNAVPLNVMGADYDHGGIAAIPPNVPGNYGAAGLQAHPEYESGRL